jgi:hypothetical protein
VSDTRDLSRRRFLLLAAALGVGAAATPALQSALGSGKKSRASRLLDCFGDLVSARAVGHACLEVLKEERSTPALLAAIERGLGGDAAYRDGAYQLRVRVSDLVRRDFEALDIVRVQGWVLSRNEARLYALAALV